MALGFKFLGHTFLGFVVFAKQNLAYFGNFRVQSDIGLAHFAQVSQHAKQQRRRFFALAFSHCVSIAPHSTPLVNHPSSGFSLMTPQGNLAVRIHSVFLRNLGNSHPRLRRLCSFKKIRDIFNFIHACNISCVFQFRKNSSLRSSFFYQGGVDCSRTNCSIRHFLQPLYHV